MIITVGADDHAVSCPTDLSKHEGTSGAIRCATPPLQYCRAPITWVITLQDA